MTGRTISFQSKTALSNVKPPFSSLDREPEYCHLSLFFLKPWEPSFFSTNCNMRISGTGHAFRYGNSFLLVVGEVYSCAQIRRVGHLSCPEGFDLKLESLWAWTRTFALVDGCIVLFELFSYIILNLAILQPAMFPFSWLFRPWMSSSTPNLD